MIILTVMLIVSVSLQAASVSARYVSSTTDTDSDGVFDDIDIDDDNDGIPDSIEGFVVPSNGSFEDSVANTTTWTLLNDTDVPFWHTTASDHKIEFWKSGFQGVPAFDGNQFVELNANQVASLYVDINVTAGDLISWTVAHRGRTGIDVARVSIGVPGSALTPFLTMSDGNTAWGVYSGLYTVPVGMTVLRLSFDSVSSASTSRSVGNFLDGMSFIVVKDEYGDGLISSRDLDSDDDGIPDNIEAQSTIDFILPRYPIVDSNNNGLDDQYETAAGGTDLVPPDTDNDGIPDIVDRDTDNDIVTDCEEGLSDATASKLCPVNKANVGANGLVDWAENVDDYTETNGIVTDPDPTNTADLEDEISGNDEAAYREAACGPAETNLTALQWKTISFPCETGSNGIEALLGASLGAYGDDADWVVYEQTGSYKADGKAETRLMEADWSVVPGKGYWIIAAEDKTAKIARPLSGISQTATVVPDGTNYPGVPVSGAAFAEVMPYDDLPDSDSTDPRILMLGNPFFKKFQLSDMYYQNGTTAYASTATLTSGTSPLEPTVYVKNSSDITTGNYTAIVPETPGFGDEIPTMQGFWIKLNAGNTDTNKITYPFEK